MRILDNIISDKKIEIETLSKIVSISDLEKQKDFTKQSKSFKESIKKSKSGIIFEFKRKSP
jgi:indole-3-glycerol phosphate synthase